MVRATARNIVAIALLGLVCASTLQAQSWTTTNGDWSTPANWTPSGPPGATSTAYIDNLGTSVVSSSGAEVGTLYVGDFHGGNLIVTNSGQLTASDSILLGWEGGPGTFTISGTGNATSGYLEVGSYGSGTLTVTNGGTLTTFDAIVGNYPLASTLSTVVSNVSSSALINGPGSTWTTGRLGVGTSGTGTLTISNGGGVTVGIDGLIIGDRTMIDLGTVATGSMIITGQNSTLTATGGGDIILGENSGIAGGIGTLTVSAGGVVNGGTSDIYLGQSSSSTGSMTVTGSFSSAARSTVSTSGNIYVGALGTGTLSANNGAQVFANGMLIGNDVPSVGSAIVDGTGSTVNLTGDLVVGGAGTGSMVISGGGSVTSNNGYVGLSDAGTGTLLVTGSNSSWAINNNLVLGNAGAAAGSLTISSAATVSAANAIIGNSTGASSALVTGAASSLALTGTLSVGEAGTGSLVVSSGAIVTDTASVIGDGVGSNGSATVTGIGSAWVTTGSLTVGNNGSGALVVSNQGTVTNTSALIGAATGSTGSATVTGTGTTWNNSSTLSVGESGAGSLTVSGGAHVTNTNGFIGKNAGSNGSATVTGPGSTWSMSGPLVIGNAGTGYLTIANGGTVSNGAATIGSASGSIGGVTVTGTGSTWSVAGPIVVGESSTSSGTLTVSGGGLVSATNLILGDRTSSSGLLVLSGSTTALSLSGALTIGNYGTGAVSIADGATFGNGSAITLGGQTSGTGIINIGAAAGSPAAAAGFIDASSITNGNGNAEVQFNQTAGGSDVYHFTTNGTSSGAAVNITGNTQVVQTAGFTELDGNGNTYTGPTTVNGGALIINGNLTGSTVTVNGGVFAIGNGDIISHSVTVNNGGTLASVGALGVSTTTSTTHIGAPLQLNTGSTTSLTIRGSTSDLINASTITISNGSSLQLIYDVAPTVSTSYTVLSAGSITGTFSNLINTLANYYILTTSTNTGTQYDVTVDYIHEYYTAFATTPNQQVIANMLDAGFGPNSPLQPLIDYMDAHYSGNESHALDLISPEQLTAMGSANLANSRSLFGMLGNRFSEIHQGQRFSDEGLVIWDPSHEFNRNSLIASNGPLPYGLEPANPSVFDNPNIGFFVSGQGTFGDVYGDSQNQGFNFSSGGAIVGADYRLGDHAAVGAYLGYQGTDTSLSDDGSIKTDSGKFGVYATYWWDNGAWINGSLGGGLHSYDTKRASINDFATGTTNGNEFTAQFQEGVDFHAKNWTFGPTLELDYSHLNIDSYTESGSMTPLAIQSQTDQSLMATIGGRVSTSIDVNKNMWKIMPYANAGLRHEFMDTKSSISASLANGTTGSFTVESSKVDSNSLVGGGGVELKFSERLSAGLGYQAEVNSDYLIQSITGSITYQF